MPSTGSISALALFLTRRAAIRATSFATGSSATSMRWGGDPTACHTQVLDCSGSRRWLATQQEARNGGQGGYKYRNRTRNFKKDGKERQPREKNAVSESVTPPLDAETPSTVSFSPEELVPGLAMLERIVKDLEAAGSTFILPPRTNAEAIELVLEPFRRLASIGVKGEFVVGGCIRHPELFKLLTSKGDETVKVLSSLVDICGMSYEDGLRLVGYYPDVAKQGETATQLALEALIACGLPAGKPLGSTVKRCPPLLFARPVDEIRQAAEALRDFFSRKQITMILQRCPQVLLKNVEEIEEKYEYIFYQMGLEGDEFTQCARWGSLALEDIIERHEFLTKCGRFMRPDAKRPQVKMENPALNKILDSSDDHFATQVAQVSCEEWIIYRALCTKSAELATKDRPFERVKPSMRKAYERRRKETAEMPDHVFDVSSSGRGLAESSCEAREWKRRGGLRYGGEYMLRMYQEFYEPALETTRQQQQNQQLAHGANEPPPFTLGPEQMSIDEHLRSLPTPPPWLGQQPPQQEFRHPQETDMLRLGQPPKIHHLPHQAQTSTGCLQQAMNGSTSDTSSSSCSPSSSENVHAGIQNDPSSIVNHAMKPEPIDDYLPSMHQMTDNHSHLLGFPRCGSSTDHHPPSSHRRSRSSQEGMLKCQYCPKKFGSQVLLDGHMRECQLIRMHECLQCQKRFKARGGLQQHMRIHNNDRPYACHFCAKRFTQKSHVDQHERIHTGAKPFSCQYCGRAFRQRSQQLGHEATHIHAAQENRSVELPKVSLPSDDILLQQRVLPPPPTSGANPAVTGLLALSQQHQQQQQQHHQHHLTHQQMLSLGQGHHHQMLQMPDFSHPSLMLNQMM